MVQKLLTLWTGCVTLQHCEEDQQSTQIRTLILMPHQQFSRALIIGERQPSQNLDDLFIFISNEKRHLHS